MNVKPFEEKKEVRWDPKKPNLGLSNGKIMKVCIDRTRSKVTGKIKHKEKSYGAKDDHDGRNW